MIILATGNEMVWGGADKGRATFQQPGPVGVKGHMSFIDVKPGLIFLLNVNH